MVRDVPSLIIPCPCLHGKGQEFAVKDSNLSKKYTQINGEIALCQKKINNLIGMVTLYLNIEMVSTANTDFIGNMIATQQKTWQWKLSIFNFFIVFFR